MGVFAPLVGIIGSMQAAEALKLLVGIGTSLVGRLQMLDARTMEWTEMRVGRDAGCRVCRASLARLADDKKRAGNCRPFLPRASQQRVRRADAGGHMKPTAPKPSQHQRIGFRLGNRGDLQADDEVVVVAIDLQRRR